jgi:hypothetical protein
MTISKERFQKMIIGAAIEANCNHPQVPAFAHALLKAVEAECEVVGHGMFNDDGKCTSVAQHGSVIQVGVKTYASRKLIALPLVSSEE